MINLITDRTLRDVERWKQLRDRGWSHLSESEKKEWLGEITPTPAASKGMYTHNDLNRVEGAVKDILSRMQSAGYNPPQLSVKTDWTYQDRFTVDDVARYYGNISQIRETITVFPDTPNAPSVNQKLTFSLANDIEKILLDVDSLFYKLTQSWYYASEIISGEV